MSGWAGGIANREWRRDRRSSDDGRLGALEDVRTILERFRSEHGWEPGMAWDPYLGEYRRGNVISAH